MRQYGLIQALRNTLEKWREIYCLALDLHLKISTKCDLCLYFNSNCDICPAKKDSICSAFPRLKNEPETLWYKCYKKSSEVIELSRKICDWLEEKIKELEEARIW
ncbi:MAG: hypothetical protein DRP27_02505 [Thermotogae bacterium]|nr:MAG: hypothetical protein DRP27_02505 [Thermotogota bacterium]